MKANKTTNMKTREKKINTLKEKRKKIPRRRRLKARRQC
jgi:hypothetical protein